MIILIILDFFYFRLPISSGGNQLQFLLIYPVNQYILYDFKPDLILSQTDTDWLSFVIL